MTLAQSHALQTHACDTIATSTYCLAGPQSGKTAVLYGCSSWLMEKNDRTAGNCRCSSWPLESQSNRTAVAHLCSSWLSGPQDDRTAVVHRCSSWPFAPQNNRTAVAHLRSSWLLEPHHDRTIVNFKTAGYCSWGSLLQQLAVETTE